MKRPLLILTVTALYVLHQDVWFWRTAHPLILGFLPLGLFYHACFSLAASLVMWMLVKCAWPSYLEKEIERGEAPRDGILRSLAAEHQESRGDVTRDGISRDLETDRRKSEEGKAH